MNAKKTKMYTILVLAAIICGCATPAQPAASDTAAHLPAIFWQQTVDTNDYKLTIELTTPATDISKTTIDEYKYIAWTQPQMDAFVNYFAGSNRLFDYRYAPESTERIYMDANMAKSHPETLGNGRGELFLYIDEGDCKQSINASNTLLENSEIAPMVSYNRTNHYFARYEDEYIEEMMEFYDYLAKDQHMFFSYMDEMDAAAEAEARAKADAVLSELGYAHLLHAKTNRWLFHPDINYNGQPMREGIEYTKVFSFRYIRTAGDLPCADSGGVGLLCQPDADEQQTNQNHQLSASIDIDTEGNIHRVFINGNAKQTATQRCALLPFEDIQQAVLTHFEQRAQDYGDKPELSIYRAELQAVEIDRGNNTYALTPAWHFYMRDSRFEYHNDYDLYIDATNAKPILFANLYEL